MIKKPIHVSAYWGDDLPDSLKIYKVAFCANMDTVNTGLNQIYTRSENHSDQNNFSEWDDFRFHIDSQFDEGIQKFKYTLGLENKISGDSQSWLVLSEDHWLYALPGASAYSWFLQPTPSTEL